jgi:hypothetical protein
VNPASLSPAELAQLLSGAGGIRVTEEDIQADLDAGAPIGADGRMNLVHFAAWLLRQTEGL